MTERKATFHHTYELGREGFKISAFPMPAGAYGQPYKGVIRLALSKAPLLIQPVTFQAGNNVLSQIKKWLNAGSAEKLSKPELAELSRALTSPLAAWRLYSVQFYPDKARLWLVDARFEGDVDETPTKTIEMNLGDGGAYNSFFVIRHEEQRGCPAKYQVTPASDGALVVDTYNERDGKSPRSTMRIFNVGSKTLLDVAELA